jgi:L-fuconolactonase
MMSGVVDAQVHVWSSLVPDPHTPQEARFEASDLLPLMDQAGVGAAILVPATWGADWNDACLAAAAETPERFAAMGRIVVEDPASRDLVPIWREQPGMLGIRISLRRDPWATMLAEGAVEWLWTAAEAAQVPVMIYLPGRAEEIAAIAERHPGLAMVVDHMAILPSSTGEERERELAGLRELARFENVAVKVSALPLYSREQPPYRDVHALARTVIDSFGPQRTCWGSDLTRLPCSYDDAVTMMDDVLVGFDDADRAEVMGGSIRRWLRW